MYVIHSLKFQNNLCIFICKQQFVYTLYAYIEWKRKKLTEQQKKKKTTQQTEEQKK